jgi:hypothetical protein
MKIQKLLLAGLVASALSMGAAQAEVRNVGSLGSTTQTFVHNTAGSFEDTINFSIAGASTLSGSANNLVLSFGSLKILNITGLMVNVWNNIHPGGTANYGSFSGNNSTYTFNLPSAGNYHVDISGVVNGSAGGVYAIALSAAPVPEPETFAMLLVGLGLVGTIARRRKTTLSA